MSCRMSMNMAKRAAAGAMKISAWSEDETDAPLPATDHIPIPWRNKQRGSKSYGCTHAQSRVGLRHGPFFIRRTQLRFLRRLRPSLVRALGDAPYWVKHLSRTATDKPVSGQLRLNARGRAPACPRACCSDGRHNEQPQPDERVLEQELHYVETSCAAKSGGRTTSGGL